MIKSKEIRKQFIDFFKDKGHSFVRSSSVVPMDDPTLLFTNAGMNQFKPYFLNLESPRMLRATNSQKCIRVSGKHNDLDEVGVDSYHHTFFEMLGNWSFGDYYKKEAIEWAWELLTDVWKLDKNRLWVTVYKDDDESKKLWIDNTDIDSSRVLKFGNKDNFWEMGEVGPCGPCTEIHYYTGKDINAQDAKGVNLEHEYREIWNLVFIQYNRLANGNLEDLPQKHVDTGAGFERLVAILNGKDSNYETDLFMPIIKQIEKSTGKDFLFKDGVCHQVIADHLRMLSFSIADGALPSNEGRGYVLRRVLRRAARYGRMLDMNTPFIFSLVETLVEIMGDSYPELKEKRAHIEKVIHSEELSFNDTLDRGIEIFDKIIENMTGKIISGEDAFKLYDTYGFPLDLTQLMARDMGYSVNIKEFDICMENQRSKGRSSNQFRVTSENESEWIEVTSGQNSEFVGYKKNESKSVIRKIRFSDNSIDIVLDCTPFYAESGGQIADTGVFELDGELLCQVVDVQKNGNEIIHFCNKEKDFPDIKGLGDSINTKIDTDRRNSIRLNHTSTHLLHSALKNVVGEHVQQAGSLVSDEKLRFDLTHYEKIQADQIKQIEDSVNQIIRENISLETNLESFESAKENGALALFGEKYEDEVRVVNIPGFSKELCGGTHVKQTGDIGAFKIVSESSLSTGVRRIEAVTGNAYIDFMNKKIELLNELKDVLNCSEGEIADKVESILFDNKKLESQFNSSQQQNNQKIFKEILSNINLEKEFNLIVERIDGVSDLRNLGDIFKDKINKKGILVIGSIINDKPTIMASVTDNLLDNIDAISIVKYAGKIINGGGGGRPGLATAGGKDGAKLDDSLEQVKIFIKDKVNYEE